MDRPVHLKVAATTGFDFEGYKNAFTEAYPKATLELVTVDNEQLWDMRDNSTYAKWLETEQPDIVVTSESDFGNLANLNLLMPLDSLVQNNGVDIQAMYAPAVNRIRELGDGTKLYGLANAFTGVGLFLTKRCWTRRIFRIRKPC